MNETILHFENGTTWRVSAHPADAGFTHATHVLLGPADTGGEQDFGDREENGKWDLRHVGSEVFGTAEAAVADGCEALDTWARENDLVSLEWVQTALFGRLAAVARGVGLDPSGWSFGQHAGLSWTLMDAKPGPGLHQIGIWQRWQDARFGIEGMIAALSQVEQHRQAARAAD